MFVDSTWDRALKALHMQQEQSSVAEAALPHGSSGKVLTLLPLETKSLVALAAAELPGMSDSFGRLCGGYATLPLSMAAMRQLALPAGMSSVTSAVLPSATSAALTTGIEMVVPAGACWDACVQG